MGDLRLVLLQYVDKTPSLAGCANCYLKFFTPQQLLTQPEAAAKYLQEKFALHTCKWEIFEETRAGTVQTRRLRIMRPTDDTAPLGICEVCNMRFRTPVHLRANAEQAKIEVRRKFGRHRCRHRDTS